MNACTLAHAVEPHITRFAVAFGLAGALGLGFGVGMLWQSRRDVRAFIGFIRKIGPRAIVAALGDAA